MVYEALKDVLLNTSYKVEEELERIYVLYSKNKLTKEEMEELEALAREKANPVNSYAPLQEQIDKLYEDMQELEARIGLLEQENGQEVEEPTEPEPVEEYPEYVQPGGAYNAYNTGDKITYNGKKYVCKIDGCVWSPDIYPAGWQEVTTDNETVIKEE